MEPNNNFTRCRFCNLYFRPQRTVINKGKSEYIECPRCGNGYSQKRRKFRREGSEQKNHVRSVALQNR